MCELEFDNIVILVIQWLCSWTEEAFQVSAKAGNDEVLYYFLQQFQTFISQEMKVQ